MKKGFAISGIAFLTITLLFLLYVLFGSDSHRYYKHDSASAQIEMVDSCVELFKEDTGNLPTSLSILATSAPNQNWAEPCIQSEGLVDPWGVPFFYQASKGENSYILFTLGADKRIGGRGNASDIQTGSLADGS